MSRSTARRPEGPRASGPPDLPYAWPRASQRARLRRLAGAWLSDDAHRNGAHRRPKAREIRFDAIAVTLDRSGALLRLDHVESAW